MPRRIIRWGALIAPRAIALGWAVWAGATAYAYRTGAPPQLARIEDSIGTPIWALWATCAILLIAGALVPSRTTRGHDIAGWLRGMGLAMTAGLLGLWAVEFFATDDARGWVSGKNYLLLAVCAISHAWYAGRHRATTRRGGGPA